MTLASLLLSLEMIFATCLGLLLCLPGTRCRRGIALIVVGSRHSDHLDKATAMANSPTLYSRVMSVADRRMVCRQLSNPIDKHAQCDTDMPIWWKCHVDGHRIESPVLEQGHSLAARF